MGEQYNQQSGIKDPTGELQKSPIKERSHVD
ncbi:hypothetical protein C5167_031177 [Papaver somniferum]|nr:hypothetical protein C5167_031177 [Papaver somniferum]